MPHQSSLQSSHPSPLRSTGRVDSPDCVAIRDVLDRVGDKWSALVIAALGGGTRRFGELRRGIEGISQRMLTVTVRNLERDGLVTRQVFAEVPPRVEYTLTELGRSLEGAIADLIRWSTDHAEDVRAARRRFEGGEAPEQHLFG